MCCDKKRPRLSVAMGVFNIASLDVFPRAIDSVLNQTMEDFEFIICDDGSTDETWNILIDLACCDERISLLKNSKNMGLAYSLNRCIESSYGELVARQDADDISAPERFIKQVRYLDVNPEVGFVGSNVVVWDKDGVWRHRSFPVYPQPKDFLFVQPFVHGSLMFRRSALEEVQGYRVSKETRRAEDYDLLMRQYAIGIRGANIQEDLYNFREDRSGSSQRMYRYRLGEAVVRWKGFQKMGLMPRALPYALKPLVVGLIPTGVLRKLKLFRQF